MDFVVISLNSPHHFFCPTVIFLFGEVIWEIAGTVNRLLPLAGRCHVCVQANIVVEKKLLKTLI